MNLRWKVLVLASLLELAILVAAHGSHGHAEHLDDDAAAGPVYYSNVTSSNSAHGSHSHMHAGTPKTVINETEILLRKGPSPLSYLELDSGLGGALSGAYGSHYGTMVAHGVFMTLAFAVALPLFLFFRIAKHTFLAGLSQAIFLGSLGLGMLTGLSYKASTPDLYRNAKHGTLGWIIFFLACVLSSAQILRAVVILFLKRDKDVPFSSRLQHLLKSNSEHDTGGHDTMAYELVGHEMTEEDEPHEGQLTPNSGHTMVDEEEDLQRRAIVGYHHQTHPSLNSQNYPTERPSSPQYWRRPHRQEMSLDLARHGGGVVSAAQKANVCRQDSHGTASSRTASSDATLNDGSENGANGHEPDQQHLFLSPGTVTPPLFESASRTHLPLRPYSSGLHSTERPSRVAIIKGVMKYGEIFLWRVMVLFGWAAVLTGSITYWGGCRSPWVNACLAHEIKGSIFFWYGIITFGRYCGAWAELGWAWNRKPNVTGTWREYWPSAEMVECLVIWLYGATNTFMERTGVPSGDPWTLHQVQHVSIAVMFFFAGSAGMILESKTCRDWISGAIINRTAMSNASAPSSYSSSFNIFPALTIGITGLAMSAHHQEYAFSVSIHALWGNLLAGFAICRILTYTFLHLRPPASILPSRPPTEALAAFCLCAGGIVFMLSTEEVIFWAMRHGFDDMMTFLNATVAFVCACLAWILVLMALKGWATRRTVPPREVRGIAAETRINRKLEGTV